jgi:hypothetical protein
VRAAGRSRLARLPRAPAVRRFTRQLRCPTRASALRSVVDGVIVATSLRRHGARRLLAQVRTDLPGHDLERSMAVSEAVDAGLGLIPMAPTCLRRSVTLVRELNRLGLAAAIHVGVRRVGGSVEAHAWVQVGDAVVNDDPVVTTTYATLAAGDLERLVVPLR